MATCAVLSFLLMSIDHSQLHLRSIRAALSVLIYPLEIAVNAPVRGVAYVAEQVQSRGALLEKNQQLREDNLVLRHRALRFKALEQENSRLRELLDSSAVFDERVIVADVLAIETAPSSRQIVVNKGTRQGVFVGQAGVDAYGVVGQISHAGLFSSTALLITDQRHALPVAVNRSGLRAVASGGPAPEQVRLAFIAGNADIRIGDLIVTSGLGGRFPAGYPVGSVVDIAQPEGAAFAEVTVETAGTVSHAREVLLIGVDAQAPQDERYSAAR